MLSRGDVERLVAEVAPVVSGARLQKIRQVGEETFLFEVYGHDIGRRQLAFVPSNEFPRFHLVAERPEAMEPGDFCRALRREIEGAHIKRLEQVAGDRVVRLELETKEGRRAIVAEFFGVPPVFCLLGEDDEILAILHERGGRRNLRPGETFPEPPDIEFRREPTLLFPGIEPDGAEGSYSEAVRRHAKEAVREDRLEALRERLEAAMERAEKRATKALEGLEKAAEKARNAERIREKGELLKANFHKLERGKSKVSVVDWYTEGNPTIEVRVPPDREPPEQLDAVFKRYRKARRGGEVAAVRRRQFEKELRLVQELEADLKGASELEELEAIEELLEEEGMLPPPQRQGRRGSSRREPYRTFRSADGFPIYVGRGAEENDTLTFRVANGNDLFFHVDGVPGSHVIVRCGRTESVPLDTLLDAGQLAVFFSRARQYRSADVMYTRRKYVKKLKGAPPGRVTVADVKTLHIAPDSSRLDRLLESQ